MASDGTPGYALMVHLDDWCWERRADAPPAAASTPHTGATWVAVRFLPATLAHLYSDLEQHAGVRASLQHYELRRDRPREIQCAKYATMEEARCAVTIQRFDLCGIGSKSYTPRAHRGASPVPPPILTLAEAAAHHEQLAEAARERAQASGEPASSNNNTRASDCTSPSLFTSLDAACVAALDAIEEVDEDEGVTTDHEGDARVPRAAAATASTPPAKISTSTPSSTQRTPMFQDIDEHLVRRSELVRRPLELKRTPTPSPDSKRARRRTTLSAKELAEIRELFGGGCSPDCVPI